MPIDEEHLAVIEKSSQDEDDPLVNESDHDPKFIPTSETEEDRTISFTT